MKRRDFLKKGSMAVGLTATGSWPLRGQSSPLAEGLAKRPLGRTEESLSIIGFGGIVVMNAPQAAANNVVAEAVDRGINYFDVAPSYGDAEQRLGRALEPYRKNSFLACKTRERGRAGAQKELEQSLRHLRTDHFDLYQLHAITTMKDVEEAFGPNGAMEVFVKAREKGQVRFLGFSAHSVQAAMAAMDRFDFDTILFPFSWVSMLQADFGPQVMKRAKEKGMGLLALKAMAKAPWPEGTDREKTRFPKCWYQPCSDPEEASLALRFTLSQPVTAAIPPGDGRLFQMAVDIAGRFTPLTEAENSQIQSNASRLKPIFPLQEEA